MNNQDINIYSAKSIYKKGFGNIIKAMFLNLIEQKELIWQLFLRDFKARYKQSLLGWLWIFLMPIITMSTFLLLNISGVIKIGDIPVPYPIFGLLGFSLWQIFSHGLQVLTASITAAGPLINQINFPKEILIFFSMGQVIVDFLIRLALVLLVYLVYGKSPSICILTLPLFLLPLIFLTLGIGFITAILNVVVRDTLNFISVGLSFFLFLMPIMYTIPEKGFLSKFNKYNPIFFLIEVPRDIIISGKIKFPLEYLLASFLALAIFLLAWFIFYIVQPKLVERI
ncbi:hypothetical protein A3J78_02060 [Candidatus Beckwithbacteria bacterium RBG_13_35_6]|uniref:ABC-2 type transporter transmembrane domain-containing protein n=1 Tax=Candidatus Beckwithbacteria bacterium RBG_13_35_6 TaxID=1797456 RepID=A0A1F5DDU2_9BACT|nr:MAG: hypothetical protein A3J78_02060 [Candidatus Beckwithbacteria bacterium RBG_13_35_6]